MAIRREDIARLIRASLLAELYSAYATLVLEHERLRRTRWRGELGATWQPDRAAWHTLRFRASVHDIACRSTQVLLEFFEAHPEKEPVPVPWHPWREALRAGVDLVADVLVLHGAELPWGRTKPRVPRNRAEFDGVARFLRDQPVPKGDPPLSELFERAALPPLPHKERPPGHRATFYRGRQVLSVDGARIALPTGRELAFLEILAERRGHGEVTPPIEGPVDWKNAADQLRRRIRRATGEKLFHAVVTPASAPVGGYRLAPGVRVRED